MINNREWALLIWLVVLGVVALLVPKLRASLASVVKAAAQPAILISIVALVSYVGGVVFLGWLAGLWETDLVVDTVVWLFGPAFGLLLSMSRVGDPSFFGRAVLTTIRVTVLIEFLVNLFVFSLPVELILQPVLTFLVLLSAVAGMKQEFQSVRRGLDVLLALIGMGLTAYVVYRLVRDWETFEPLGSLRLLVLPVWLTLTVIPFIYLYGAFAIYQAAFMRMAGVGRESEPQWRARLGLVSVLHFRLRLVGEFHGYWASQAASAKSLGHARQAVKGFLSTRREEARAKKEKDDRLIEFAGVFGVDDEGRQLDQREFEETRRSLLALSTSQMGWYHNHGGRYRPELLSILGRRFDREGLPDPHGIEMVVAEDGQSWWAWRETITGWVFAIGASGPPPDQWLYDGPKAPEGPPGDDTAWGERWGSNAENW